MCLIGGVILFSKVQNNKEYTHCEDGIIIYKCPELVLLLLDETVHFVSWPWLTTNHSGDEYSCQILQWENRNALILFFFFATMVTLYKLWQIYGKNRPEYMIVLPDCL